MNNTNLQDLQSDMDILEHDYEYFLELAYSNYSSYDFKMEIMNNAITTLDDIMYLNKCIIKKKHCE